MAVSAGIVNTGAALRNLAPRLRGAPHSAGRPHRARRASDALAGSLPGLRAADGLSLFAEVPPAENVVLVLDNCARIRFCSSAAGRVFGHRPTEVLGTDVTRLIPGLPLRKNTPGYNLAYATFQCESGAPRCFLGRHANGGEFALDVAMETISLQGRHGLIVALRMARAGDSSGHGA